MCKLLVTCYIPLLLAIAANGTTLAPSYKQHLEYAIQDVTELEKMNINIENDGFYTPENFPNNMCNKEALDVYMTEMNTLKEELEDNPNAKSFIALIKRNLQFMKIQERKICEDCKMKNIQEFLKGLKQILQCIYSDYRE